jgi:enterochelin esterase family protein
MRPMIVVTPNANWDLPAAPAHSPSAAAGAENGPPMGLDMDKGVNDLVDGQIRYIESHYRTMPGRENRAIARLSMGG